MVTKSGLNDLKLLIEGTLDSTGRELKTVLDMMKKDGLEDMIGPYRYPEYLIPFKELIRRENNNN